MAELTSIEKEAGEQIKGIDCVEIYLPKRLSHLSELYNFLRRSVTDRVGSLIVLDGFSIYEVDGFFRGAQEPWEERSLVIRILLVRSQGTDELQLRARVRDLGREIANKIAVKEEEVWICDFRQRVTVFRPNAKIIF
ncbi:MAG TPA: hypothetical protein VFC78_03055 [Tepidisphaeraceae bacterium]|nr:hypothetical protein [Tepidisphaeraceae bacterium]